MPKTTIAAQNTYSVTVTVTGTTVVFKVNDDKVNALSSTKLIQSVLLKALLAWITTNSAALTTNGDTALLTWRTERLLEEPSTYARLTWNISNKSCAFVALTTVAALTTTTLTVVPPHTTVRS